MAKTTNGKIGDFEVDASVTDAVEMSESTADETTELKTTEPATDDPIADGILENEDVVDLDGAPDDGLEVGSVEDALVAPSVKPDSNPTEELDESAEEPEMAHAVQTPARRENATSRGFILLLIGGLAAGTIGFVIAAVYDRNNRSGDMSVQLAAQADQIAALEAQIANILSLDLTNMDAQISDLSDKSTAQVDELSDRLGTRMTAFDDRLTDVEMAPESDGTLSDTGPSAYQIEIDQLRAEMTIQQEDVMSVAAQAEADLAAIRQEAAELEQEAVVAARAASVRAALNRVAAAVETGALFGDALFNIDVNDLPVALIDAAESGVATTAQLTQEFPAAARSALATARAEGVSDDARGFGGFLRSQFDVRSTAPREGAGPDAVLSRAEAAIKEGRVADALVELDALPQVARAEMKDWTARATQRADVLDAIATLSETFN